MKMCEKCWNQDCTKCIEALAYVNYYAKEMQVETGIEHEDVLDVVEAWLAIKTKEFNDEVKRKRGKDE